MKNRKLTKLEEVLATVRQQRPVWLVTAALGEVLLKYVAALSALGLIRECTDEEVAAHAKVLRDANKPVNAKEGEK